MAMYENARSAANIHGTISEAFNVNAGVDQGSVLAHCFLSLYWRHSLESSKKDYPTTDGLVLMAESLKEFESLYDKWKHRGKGLHVNIGKTKVMISQHGHGLIPKTRLVNGLWCMSERCW